MKIAFSKPTRDDAGQRELFDGFRSAGYAGLQLKGNQYGEFVADPPGFAGRWGGGQALTSALITITSIWSPRPLPAEKLAIRAPIGTMQANETNATQPIGMSCSVRGSRAALPAARAREAAMAVRRPAITGLTSFASVHTAATPMVPAPTKRT